MSKKDKRAKRRRILSLLKKRAMKIAKNGGPNVRWAYKNANNLTGRWCWCCSNPRQGNGLYSKTRQERKDDLNAFQ